MERAHRRIREQKMSISQQGFKKWVESEIKYENITSHHKKKLHRSILASMSLLELSIWCNMSNLSSGQLM